MPIGSISRHLETEVSFGSFGVKPSSYQKTFNFAGAYVDDYHRFLGTCPLRGALIDIGIPGWLRREDALKLYECGYFTRGNILEFGTNRGLSATILAKSLIKAKRSGTIITMELSATYLKEARKNFSNEGVGDRIDSRCADANSVCSELAEQGQSFGFAFVDHSHAYEDVVQACRHLKNLLTKDAFVVFHDYNDARNTRRTGRGDIPDEFGVFAGVEDGLDKNSFEFMGVYGCCGLFRRM